MINISKWLLLLPVNHSTPPSSSPNIFSLPLFKYKATQTVCYPFFCMSLSLSFCRSFLALTLQIHRWIVLSERTSSHTSHSGSLQSNYSILVNLASIWQAAWPGKPGLDKVYYKSVNFSNAHPLQTLFILYTNAQVKPKLRFFIYHFIFDFYHPWRDLELFMKSGVPHHRGSGFIVIPYTTSTTEKKVEIRYSFWIIDKCTWATH